MKSLYVINLDKRRIFIVCGTAFITLSAAFFAGKYSQSSLDSNKVRLADESQHLDFQKGQRFEAQQVLPEGGSSAVKENTRHNATSLLGELNTNNDLQGNTLQGANGAQNSIAVQNELSVEDDPLVYSPRREKQAQSFQNVAAEKSKSEAKSKTEKSKSKAASSSSSKNSSLKTFYTIQLGVFKKKEDAIAMQKKINIKGIRVDKGIKNYFVNVGKAEDSESLEQTLQKIKSKYTKTAANAKIVRKKLG